MNNKILLFPKKSLRQIPISRYNPRVDNYAKAPHRRLFSFPDTLLRTGTSLSPFICNDLHTLVFRHKTTLPLSITYTLFKKHRGYTPKSSHFGTVAETCNRGRFPDRGPFPRIVATTPTRQPTRSQAQPSIAPTNRAAIVEFRAKMAVPIFTCKEKAISFTLTPFTRNVGATRPVYTDIPLHRTDLQETDR
jgi:hypothetical protein